MEQYINKSTIITEIEKKQKEEVNYNEDGSFASLGDQIYYSTLESFKNFINTLEVEENDLVEEIDYKDFTRFFKEHPDYNDGSLGFEEMWTFAQYFYTLGLRAQKE